MDSIKNSANFELCFIFFYEHYAQVMTATKRLGAFGEKTNKQKKTKTKTKKHYYLKRLQWLSALKNGFKLAEKSDVGWLVGQK